MLVAWKHIISFEIKKQNSLYVSLITEEFVFLVNFVGLMFEIFRDRMVNWEVKDKTAHSCRSFISQIEKTDKSN